MNVLVYRTIKDFCDSAEKICEEQKNVDMGKSMLWKKNGKYYAKMHSNKKILIKEYESIEDALEEILTSVHQRNNKSFLYKIKKNFYKFMYNTFLHKDIEEMKIEDIVEALQYRKKQRNILESLK